MQTSNKPMNAIRPLTRREGAEARNDHQGGDQDKPGKLPPKCFADGAANERRAVEYTSSLSSAGRCGRFAEKGLAEVPLAE